MSAGQTILAPAPRLKISAVDPQWFSRRTPPDERRAEFEREHALAEQYPGKILRWMNLLALKLDNGLFVWLVDVGDNPADLAGTSGSGCCESYRLQDYWPDLGLYVVTLNRSEIGSTLLISQQTADVLSVAGTPHRNAADTTSFAATTASDLEGYSVQVWGRTQTRWTKLYECQNLIYGATFAEWTGPKSLDFAVDGHPEKRYKLSATGGAWQTDACEH